MTWVQRGTDYLQGGPCKTAWSPGASVGSSGLGIEKDAMTRLAWADHAWIVDAETQGNNTMLQDLGKEAEDTIGLEIKLEKGKLAMQKAPTSREIDPESMQQVSKHSMCRAGPETMSALGGRVHSSRLARRGCVCHAAYTESRATRSQSRRTVCERGAKHKKCGGARDCSGEFPLTGEREQ